MYKFWLRLVVLLVFFVGAAPQLQAQSALENALRGIFSDAPNADQPTVKRIVPESNIVAQISFAPLVKLVAPAVVNIYAARKVTRRSPFQGDPFYEQFFGKRGLDRLRPRKRVQRSLGSGVIVGSSGIVVTNFHVIKGATEIKVALADGREYNSKLLLGDEKSDLAILRIQADETFPVVKMGNSESLEVGDIVLAIGNPFGVGQTVTTGIVSALARPSLGKGDFGFFIQTDASINPGNSGGALVDMRGKLIGINTAIFSRSGGSNGIGFAIPSNMVAVVLGSAAKGNDRVVRPWIGAQFQNLTADIAASLGMLKPRGALVSGVIANSPAELAGLQVGDVVLRVNNKSVQHIDALGYRLATIGVGKRAVFSILSKNQRKELTIQLASAPETVPRDQRNISGRSPFSGLRVANLSPALAIEIGINSGATGVVITRVKRGSPARHFGMRPRDIIASINGAKITSTRQLEKLSRKGARSWNYVLVRDGRKISQFVR